MKRTDLMYKPRLPHAGTAQAPTIPKGPGKLVRTKKGEEGRTYNSVGLINTKVAVYFDSGVSPRLFNAIDLEHIGFHD